jgi:predicted  nucleic acid-binding Zn-ribbon protein
MGWTGKRCPKCNGCGQIFDDRGEEVSCPPCGGTGDEYISAEQVCKAWVEFKPKVPLRFYVAARKAAREGRWLNL